MRTLKKLGTAVVLAIGFAYAAPAIVHAETTVTVTSTTTSTIRPRDLFRAGTKTYYWRSGNGGGRA